VGLPGEGEEEFQELCEFLREVRIERAGVFVFSPEEGTPAAAMPGQVDRETAERRAELVMELQSAIMDEFNRSRIGQTLEVLCEGFDEDMNYWYGRSYADSPDIDGRVYFTGDGQPGEFMQVRITDILDGDLLGESV
jgi:ribosomal protein S12 methylthiotransferase